MSTKESLNCNLITSLSLGKIYGMDDTFHWEWLDTLFVIQLAVEKPLREQGIRARELRI